jgi:hypothetical protein
MKPRDPTRDWSHPPLLLASADAAAAADVEAGAVGESERDL